MILGKILNKPLIRNKRSCCFKKPEKKYLMIAPNVKIGFIILQIQADSMENLVIYKDEFLASIEKQMWLQGKTFARV